MRAVVLTGQNNVTMTSGGVIVTDSNDTNKVDVGLNAHHHCVHNSIIGAAWCIVDAEAKGRQPIRCAQCTSVPSYGETTLDAHAPSYGETTLAT